MRYLVAVGDPFDGLDLIGPFEDEADAVSWAEDIIGSAYSGQQGSEWHVVPMSSADEMIEKWSGAPP